MSGNNDSSDLEQKFERKMNLKTHKTGRQILGERTNINDLDLNNDYSEKIKYLDIDKDKSLYHGDIYDYKFRDTRRNKRNLHVKEYGEIEDEKDKFFDRRGDYSYYDRKIVNGERDFNKYNGLKLYVNEPKKILDARLRQNGNYYGDQKTTENFTDEYSDELNQEYNFNHRNGVNNENRYENLTNTNRHFLEEERNTKDNYFLNKNNHYNLNQKKRINFDKPNRDEIYFNNQPDHKTSFRSNKYKNIQKNDTKNDCFIDEKFCKNTDFQKIANKNNNSYYFKEEKIPKNNKNQTIHRYKSKIDTDDDDYYIDKNYPQENFMCNNRNNDKIYYEKKAKNQKYDGYLQSNNKNNIRERNIFYNNNQNMKTDKSNIRKNDHEIQNFKAKMENKENIQDFDIDQSIKTCKDTQFFNDLDFNEKENINISNHIDSLQKIKKDIEYIKNENNELSRSANIKEYTLSIDQLKKELEEVKNFQKKVIDIKQKADRNIEKEIFKAKEEVKKEKEIEIEILNTKFEQECIEKDNIIESLKRKNKESLEKIKKLCVSKIKTERNEFETKKNEIVMTYENKIAKYKSVYLRLKEKYKKDILKKYTEM